MTLRIIHVVIFLALVFGGNEALSQQQFIPQKIDSSFHYNKMNFITNQDSNLTFVGHFGWGACEAVASKSNIVYAGNGSLIHVLDMSDPSSPLLVNEIDNTGFVDDLVVRDNFLYSLNPLQIFDITDPVNPERLYLSDKWAGYELLLDSNFVYIPNYIVIYMIDISSSEEPILAGEIYPPGFTTDVAKYKNYLYNNTGDALFVEIWDISDKASPVEVGRTGHVSIKEDIKIDGDFLFIAPIEIWDLSDDPTDPVFIGSYAYPEFIPDVYEIEIADTLMYAAMRNKGLSVINIKDKSNPYEIENIEWVGYPSESLGPWQIDVRKDRIYSAARTGLWIMDIFDGDSLSNTSFYNTGFLDYDVVVDETYGYIASSAGGLIIFNYGDPYNPYFVCQLPTWGAALKLTKKDDIIILLTHTDILFIDVTNKRNPIEISRVPGRYFFSMMVTDSLVICGSDSSNIRIINYSDPNNPFIEKEFETTKFPGDFAQYKNYLFSAEGYNGIRIYDISQENPIEVNSITGESGLGLLVRNNRLYSAMGGELRIYRLDNPSDPVLIGSTTTPGARSNRVNLDMDKNDSSYIYMFYGYNIEVIDITKESKPIIAAYFRGDPAVAWGLDIKGKCLFAAQGFLGLNIFTNDLITSVDNNEKIRQPQDFVLHPNYPNPFNSSTAISFYLSKSDFITIKIYDVLGKELSGFSNTQYKQAGKHEFLFDGDNLSSGIYYISVKSGTIRKTIKTVLLK